MGKQREKNRFVIDKNQTYKYNIAIIILGELYNEGIIDIFDMVEALIKLRNRISLTYNNYGNRLMPDSNLDISIGLIVK